MPSPSSKREIITTLLTQCGISFSEKTVISYMAAWWYNTRADNKHFRLTDQGLNVLQVMGVQNYTVKIPAATQWTAGLLLQLSELLPCPFHLQQNQLIIFDDSVAVELYLFDGNVADYVASKQPTGA